MLPTRVAVVDEHDSSVSSAANNPILIGEDSRPLLGNDSVVEVFPLSSNVATVNRDATFGSISVVCSDFLDSCRNKSFWKSPTLRSCGKKLSNLVNRKMIVLSDWMGHITTNWKATLRYVLGMVVRKLDHYRFLIGRQSFGTMLFVRNLKIGCSHDSISPGCVVRDSIAS